MRIFALILHIILVGSASAEVSNVDFSLFGLTERSIPSGEAWFAANHSKSEYCVSVRKGSLHIVENGNSCRHKPLHINWEDFKFVGENHGEFGGGLYVQKIDKPQSKRVELLKENIISLNVHGNDLYVFTGLAHLGMSKGAVYRVNLKDKQFKAHRLTLLPGAPAVVLDNTSSDRINFTIVTSDGLVGFDPEYDLMSVYLINQFWSGLYPGSAVQLDHVLYIGMRSGVAKIELEPLAKAGKVSYYAK